VTRSAPIRLYPIQAISADPLNVHDFERLAEEALEPGAFGYFAGGAGDEVTLRENVEAFQRRHLRPRMLADVSNVTTETEVLGHKVSMPLLVAPLAYQRVAHPEGEVATAKAAASAGTVFCLSTLASTGPSEITEGRRWFQLYVFSDRGITSELLAEAAEAGFEAVVLTVDVPLSGRRERDLRTSFTLPEGLVPSIGRAGMGERIAPHDAIRLFARDVSWRDIETFSAQTSLPVLVKGILTAEDALLACESGAAGVVVSNHGGRQLDGVQASLDALPDIVEAVGGRVPVLMDGGVRRGTDVLKALALGAQATLAGRPFVWGLAVDGERGVMRVLELLRDEIELGLALLGCRSPAEVSRSHVTC
jgi:isopentenyl diphosphate isomerase/L-lactate dehydrogenase-like FMN-dependent dehydrogenase